MSPRKAGDLHGSKSWSNDCFGGSTKLSSSSTAKIKWWVGLPKTWTLCETQITAFSVVSTATCYVLKTLYHTELWLVSSSSSSSTTPDSTSFLLQEPCFSLTKLSYKLGFSFSFHHTNIKVGFGNLQKNINYGIYRRRGKYSACLPVVLRRLVDLPRWSSRRGPRAGRRGACWSSWRTRGWAPSPGVTRASELWAVLWILR